MNKLFLLLGFYLIGVESYAAPIDSALKTPHEPSYFSVVISLLCVICIIYIIGIIYNKLNNLGLKTLKLQTKNFSEDRILILSTTPLGPNKTLHVVELNGKKMLIGASANSIHLIKDLSENNTDTNEDSFKESEISQPTEQEEKVEEDEDFGLYKKYLR